MQTENQNLPSLSIMIPVILPCLISVSQKVSLMLIESNINPLYGHSEKWLGIHFQFIAQFGNPINFTLLKNCFCFRTTGWLKPKSDYYLHTVHHLFCVMCFSTSVPGNEPNTALKLTNIIKLPGFGFSQATCCVQCLRYITGIAKCSWQ